MENLDQTGRHYMIDKSLIRYIALEAMLLPDDVVLEIGTGHGELTREIAKKCKVISVDIEDHGVSGKNITFIQANILEKFMVLFEQYGFNKIFSNIPYNISEPLMRQIFKINIEHVMFVCGENFANILTARDTRLGVLSNELFEVKILKRIPPKSFRPMPRVQSSLVSLEQRDIDEVDYPAVIYKKLVLLDDKKLRNALITILSGTKKEIKDKISDPIFEKSLYSLSNVDFRKMDKILRSNDFS